jgi:hypothetical protein
MLTPIPQMMLISHRPKLAPATLSAATQPVPKDQQRSAQEFGHALARKWVVVKRCHETSFFVVWRFFIISSVFTGSDPHQCPVGVW